MMDISIILLSCHVFPTVPTPDSGYKRKLCSVTEKRTIHDVVVTTPSSRYFFKDIIDRNIIFVLILTHCDKILIFVYLQNYFVFVWLFATETNTFRSAKCGSSNL